MGIVSQFRAAVGQALPPWDDYWYQRPGVDSASGMQVSPETAMRLSAVFSCVRVKSETLASCPLIIYRHLPNGGRERASNHPLYRVLHDTPNRWQTSLEFIEMMQAHLDLRGNAFARIVPGPSGAVDQLVPLHPDLVQVYRLPNGKLKYGVQSRFSAEVDWYLQEEIFHLRALSSDGLVGLSPIALQRETIGNGLAMDDQLGRLFLNGLQPSGILVYPGRFKDDAARVKFGESLRQANTGANRHKHLVLEDGMDYKAVGLNSKDAEFLESRKMNREEIAGLYRVPPHKIGILERSTNNNIEHQGIEFVTDCMRPAAVRWERRINVDLIEALELNDGSEYFAEFTLDGLLRGDMKSRYDAYFVGRNGGWLSPNDVCRFENMNPIPPEKGGDDYIRAVNYVVAGAALPAAPGEDGAIPPNDPPPDAPDDEGADSAAAAQLRLLAVDKANQLVRREVGALRKALGCSARDGGARLSAAFESQLHEFYAKHEQLLAAVNFIPSAAAGEYCRKHMRLLLDEQTADAKISAIDWIEDTAPEELAGIALGRKPKGLLQ
jgi:HK97 family phage portal protein